PARRVVEEAMASEEPNPDDGPVTTTTTTEEEPGVEHAVVRISPDRPLGLLHTGSRHSFGFTPNGYGIWDNMSSGPPAERFPASKAGRITGWQRYVELEPGAEDAVKAAIAADNPPPEAVEVGGLRRWRWVIVAGVLAVGLAV